ncbi:uncharacterized protein LOC106073886 [Biomphalaria glabrata]|uniref:Uncharacterized protein LOC106073886 n=1 Tax=Biomphalaria glabrata TaxID=6526 RepID=A0A9W2YWW6_BIOGL|nr:uncharacterized protein LOC106073886 [Biomphalaria glabrata]XP_055867210.1 uncharacterized protein LOC106073886 [Biomphalaria glabrata]
MGKNDHDNQQVEIGLSEAEDVRSRNIRIIFPNQEEKRRNVFLLETPQNLIESYYGIGRDKCYSVLLCLPLENEVKVSMSADFSEYFDQIESIKIVPTVYAETNPPITYDLDSVIKYKNV